MRACGWGDLASRSRFSLLRGDNFLIGSVPRNFSRRLLTIAPLAWRRLTRMLGVFLLRLLRFRLGGRLGFLRLLCLLFSRLRSCRGLRSWRRRGRCRRRRLLRHNYDLFLVLACSKEQDKPERKNRYTETKWFHALLTEPSGATAACCSPLAAISASGKRK